MESLLSTTSVEGKNSHQTCGLATVCFKFHSYSRWLSEEEIRENRDVAYKSKKDQSASAAVSSSNADRK